MNQQQRRISRTERSVLQQLPGDIFGFDSKALDRAASFGLVPMQGGWIAGGIIGRVAMARMRSALQGNHREMRPDLHPKRCPAPSQEDDPIASIDPGQCAKSLSQLRTELLKRGLLR